MTPQVQGLEEAVQANANNPLNFLNYWVSLDNSDVSIRLIMVILLILFGYKRMGQLGKGLGEGIRNFKDSIRSTNSVMLL